jgi:hypothetical protein
MLSNNFPTCFATIYGFRFIVLPLNNYPASRCSTVRFSALFVWGYIRIPDSITIIKFVSLSVYPTFLCSTVRSSALFVCGYIQDPSLCLNLFLSVFLSKIRKFALVRYAYVADPNTVPRCCLFNDCYIIWSDLKIIPSWTKEFRITQILVQIVHNTVTIIYPCSMLTHRSILCLN